MKKIIDIGIKPSYETWEIFFTRKINLIALIGGFNVIVSYFIFPLFNVLEFQTEMLVMSIASPFVFLINHRFGYIAAAYFFNICSGTLMFFLTTKMGIDSYVVLFYFPLLLSLIHLMGRRETFNHLLILLGFYLVCVFGVALAYQYEIWQLKFDAETFKILRLFVLLLCMTTSVAFFGIITYETIKQEELIKKMLREKDVLLAEVYHRVKNNMSIVTSLLNLKKHNSDSEEVRDALEACRSRVYSMSLVHEKFFAQKNLIEINFAQYAKDLTNAITSSFGYSNTSEIIIEAEDLNLDVAQAIPCGLILNELLTNSFKHASATGRLKIKIQVSQQDKYAELCISDNGPGFDPETSKNKGSMGIDLIHSLCEQLDATCSYKNQNGSTFVIRFIPVKK